MQVKLFCNFYFEQRIAHKTICAYGCQIFGPFGFSSELRIFYIRIRIPNWISDIRTPLKHAPRVKEKYADSWLFTTARYICGLIHLLTSQVRFLQHSHWLCITLCYINLIIHILDRAHSTGHVILIQNSNQTFYSVF